MDCPQCVKAMSACIHGCLYHKNNPFHQSFSPNTYIDLLPLADVAHQTRQTQQSDQGKQLGEPQDPEGAARMEDLEAVAIILEQFD